VCVCVCVCVGGGGGLKTTTVSRGPFWVVEPQGEEKKKKKGF
jgi:hypothetical protein